MSKLDDLRLKKGVMYRDLFNTPLGEDVLKDLELHFNPEKLTTDNPHTTIVRTSESTPIRYIKRRIEDGMA